MLKRRTKELFYAAFGPVMLGNAKLHRVMPRYDTSIKRAHLGPGQQKYMNGWLNIDANAFTAKCDIWADLRYPLPLKDNSMDAVYSHHVIEHLPNREAHLADVLRVLRPGGVYRVAGPNGDSAVRKLLAGDSQWFGSWPDNRRSVGGRFENFIFCRGEHVTILFEDFMRELLEDAGFTNIRTARAEHETHYPDLFSDVLAGEHEGDPELSSTLVLEAVKPG